MFLFLLLVTFGLMGCKRRLTRPEIAPQPPLVPCDVPYAGIPPVVPSPAGMDVWALEMLGLYEIAAGRIVGFNACLKELRAKGVIR